GCETEDNEAQAIERDGAVAPAIDLKCHCKVARPFARADGHLPGQARAYEVAVTGFVVLPVHLPRRRCHRSASLALIILWRKLARFTATRISSTPRDPPAS